jgi:hypothetical protein
MRSRPDTIIINRPEEISEEDKTMAIRNIITRYEIAKKKKGFDLFKYCKNEAINFFK